MADNTPSVNEWQELYKAMDEFVREACWKFMNEQDIFAIQNPETREIGYCSVMGASGEHYALSVYKGVEGLKNYYAMQFLNPADGEQNLTMDFLTLQDCIMASLEQKDLVEEEELKFMKKLGYPTHEMDSFPQFRNYKPGYIPWYLDAEEVKFLAHCLRQTVLVGKRFKDDPEYLDFDETKYLLLEPVEKEGVIEWHDSIIDPDLGIEEEEEPPPSPDVKRINNTANAARATNLTWEIDYFLFPQPFQDNEGERPYFPIVLLIVNSDDAIILKYHIQPYDGSLGVLQDLLLNTLEKGQVKPAEIQSTSKEVLNQLKPVADQIQISLKQKENLQGFNEASEALLSSMDGDEG